MLAEVSEWTVISPSAVTRASPLYSATPLPFTTRSAYMYNTYHIYMYTIRAAQSYIYSTPFTLSWHIIILTTELPYSGLFSRGVYFSNFEIAAIHGINFREIKHPHT